MISIEQRRVAGARRQCLAQPVQPMAGYGMGIIKRLMGNSVRRHYRARGYQIFRGAFPKDQISAVGDMVHRLIPGLQWRAAAPRRSIRDQ
jgi:hypothetical protein